MGADTSPAVVSVAFGWRAREAERQSTAPVRFSDRDLGTVILEREPVGRALSSDAARLILEVRLEDDRLGGALFAMLEARRARHAGETRTLADWDARPTEALGAAP